MITLTVRRRIWSHQFVLLIIAWACGSCSERTPGGTDSDAAGANFALVNNASTATSPTMNLNSDREQSFDSQGHRGARGLLPENTIAGAELAVEYGMRTVELDLAVSADNQLVVSHEPHFNPTICELEGTGYDEETSLFALDYAAIARVDCGAKGHPEFPNQQPLPSSKPTLAALVSAADAKARSLGSSLPAYNIELKADPKLDGVYTPSPAAFAALVAAEIDRLGIAGRCNVQSFDPRPLREIRTLKPDLRIAFLVGLPEGPSEVESKRGFKPEIYSPHHLTLTQGQVERYQSSGIAVIPWTVNDASRMRTLLSWGVDGIITDYPDRLSAVLTE